jgi:hypothetical protein
MSGPLFLIMDTACPFAGAIDALEKALYRCTIGPTN